MDLNDINKKGKKYLKKDGRNWEEKAKEAADELLPQFQQLKILAALFLPQLAKEIHTSVANATDRQMADFVTEVQKLDVNKLDEFFKKEALPSLTDYDKVLAEVKEKRQKIESMSEAEHIAEDEKKMAVALAIGALLPNRTAQFLEDIGMDFAKLKSVNVADSVRKKRVKIANTTAEEEAKQQIEIMKKFPFDDIIITLAEWQDRVTVNNIKTLRDEFLSAVTPRDIEMVAENALEFAEDFLKAASAGKAASALASLPKSLLASNIKAILSALEDSFVAADIAPDLDLIIAAAEDMKKYAETLENGLPKGKQSKTPRRPNGPF